MFQLQCVNINIFINMSLGLAYIVHACLRRYKLMSFIALEKILCIFNM